MSLAENLLNTLNGDSAGDSTELTNIEEPIIVDETRRIIVPDKLKTIAVTGDKDVETVTFKCIRYWDTVHDLSNFVIYINYILPNNDTGTYIPTIKERYEDYFTFDWVIGREITKYNGDLTFLILARKTDSNGILDYQWSSLLNCECTIAKGLDIINVADDEETEDNLTRLLQLPLENGMSENSIQQESCVAGLKGFYWSAINVTNKTITLSTVNGSYGTAKSFNIADYWVVGDVISIHNNKKWTNCSQITTVSQNTITVDSLPFSSVMKESGHITDQAVYVLAKPDKGLCDFGQNSVAFGENCKATNYATVVGGRNNQALSQYAAIFGRDNVGEYASLVGGRGNQVTKEYGFSAGAGNIVSAKYAGALGRKNEVTAEGAVAVGGALYADNWNNKASGVVSFVAGEKNNVSGRRAVAFGYDNDVQAQSGFVAGEGIQVTASAQASAGVGLDNVAQHHQTFVAGRGHFTKRPYQAIFGRYSDHTSMADAVLVVGDGTSDTNRRNVFKVIEDGSVYGGDKKLATEDFAVPRISPSSVSYYQVYGVDPVNGTQTTFRASSGGHANSVILLNDSGHASVPDPKSASQIANKRYVDSKIAKFDFIKVVDTLPETGLENRIYFVPNANSQNQDLFDEYFWINRAQEGEADDYGWEYISTKRFEVALKDYVSWGEGNDYDELGQYRIPATRSSDGSRHRLLATSTYPTEISSDNPGLFGRIPISNAYGFFEARDMDRYPSATIDRLGYFVPNKKYVDKQTDDAATLGGMKFWSSLPFYKVEKHGWHSDRIIPVVNADNPDSNDMFERYNFYRSVGIQGILGTSYSFEKLDVPSAKKTNQKYANALVGTVSGSAVSMDDVSPLEHKVAVKVASKNLIPYPYPYFTEEVTKSGVTFTPLEDGGILINGTTTEMIGVNLADLDLPVNLLGGTANGGYIANRMENGGCVIYSTLSKRVTLRIWANNTFDNVIFYPQIEKGTVVTEYAPYVADDTEVTVKSCGKNLFDRTKEDVINGELYNLATYIQRFYLKPNTKYTFSTSVPMAIEGVTANIYFNGSTTGTYGCWNGQPRTTTTDENGYLYMLFSVDNIDTVFSSSYFMQLEEASEATAYEPFVGETITTTLAEGAEVTSIAPNMTIYTDNASAVVEASYNKDTNIVIEKLTQAIISLGGNV